MGIDGAGEMKTISSILTELLQVFAYTAELVKVECCYMGILEFLLGLLLFAFVANLFLSLIPLPRGIAGTIIAIIIVLLAWRLIF